MSFREQLRQEVGPVGCRAIGSGTEAEPLAHGVRGALRGSGRFGWGRDRAGSYKGRRVRDNPAYALIPGPGPGALTVLGVTRRPRSVGQQRRHRSEQLRVRRSTDREHSKPRSPSRSTPAAAGNGSLHQAFEAVEGPFPRPARRGENIGDRCCHRGRPGVPGEFAGDGGRDPDVQRNSSL